MQLRRQGNRLILLTIYLERPCSKTSTTFFAGPAVGAFAADAAGFSNAPVLTIAKNDAGCTGPIRRYEIKFSKSGGRVSISQPQSGKMQNGKNLHQRDGDVKGEIQNGKDGVNERIAEAQKKGSIKVPEWYLR